MSLISPGCNYIQKRVRLLHYMGLREEQRSCDGGVGHSVTFGTLMSLKIRVCAACASQKQVVLDMIFIIE
jgi:hypothetical protein